MLEEKIPTRKSMTEIEAAMENEVLTINHKQFIMAAADAATDEPLNELVRKNPMLIMLFSVIQRVIWDKCVELTTKTDTTNKKEEEYVD